MGGDGTGRSSTADNRTTIRAMQVCPMIDLKPLMGAIHAAYAWGPNDIKPGRGIDPDGVVCAAGLRRVDGADTYVASGEVSVAVVPYLSDDDAVGNYDNRVTREGKNTNASTEELSGAWDQGSLIRSQDGSHSSAYAVVRKDDYLVKVAVTMSATGAHPASISVANESTRPVLEDILTSLYDRVGTELNG